MGIKGLRKFIDKYCPNAVQELTANDLKHKTIAFDTSILIYQFVIAIRNTGNDLTNFEGKITSHIHAIIMKAMSFLKKKIRPVFIFDGKPPDIKLNTLKDRVDIRNNANVQLNILNSIPIVLETESIKETQMDISEPILEVEDAVMITEELKKQEIKEQKIKFLKQSTVVTGKQMRECKEILHLMGIPVVEASQEADSQCAYLSKEHLVDAVASEDMDLLTFGVEKLLRNMNGKKIAEISLSKILSETGLTYEQFIDLCILLGCDYCPTIEGIGMVKAYQIIKRYKSIEAILKIPNFRVYNKIIYISDDFKTKYLVARNYFLNPPINTELPPIEWKVPDYEKLEDILVNKYSYNQATVHKILIKPLTGGFYKTIAGKTNSHLQSLSSNDIEEFDDSEDDLFLDEEYSDDFAVSKMLESNNDYHLKNLVSSNVKTL